MQYCKISVEYFWNVLSILRCYVGWFFFSLLGQKNGNWKMAQGCRLYPTWRRFFALKKNFFLEFKILHKNGTSKLWQSITRVADTLTHLVPKTILAPVKVQLPTRLPRFCGWTTRYGLFHELLLYINSF